MWLNLDILYDWIGTLFIKEISKITNILIEIYKFLMSIMA